MSANQTKIRFPCISCRKEVKWNHNALLCVSCKKWAHWKCSRASNKTFHSGENWICDTCIFQELPQNVSFSDAENGQQIQSTVNEYEYINVKDAFESIRSLSGINIAHLNICSLIKNIDEIRHILTNENIHVLSLCETRLDDTISDSEIAIQGYRCIRSDRNRSGGGIITYIDEHIPFNVRNDLSMDGLELLCIEVCLPKQKPLITVYWYRPPNSHSVVFDQFETLLQSLESSSKDVMIYGDLNCDLIKKPLTCQTKRLNGLAAEFDLRQYVNKPTRVTPSSATLIDVFYSSNHDKITFCDVIPISISDHYMVVCSLGKSKPVKCGHRLSYCRNTKKLNLENFNSDLEKLDWDDVLADSDPVSAYEKWSSKFISVLDKHAPLRKKRIRQKEAPWISIDILEKIRERNDMKRRAHCSKTDEDWKSYKKLRNTVTDMVRKAKRKYVSESIHCNNGDSNAMWKSLRRIMPKKKKETSIQKLEIEGSEVKGSRKIASCLNDHFVSLASRRKKSKKFGKNLKQYLTRVKSKFSFRQISADEVIRVVNGIARNKATGLDQIPASIIKDSIDHIVVPLTHILNLSLTTGKIPDIWKKARVTPIHKGGDASNPSNYRPISVLPVLSKVLEKIVFDQVYTYLCQNDILCPHQHGFRPEHSTLTALWHLTNEICKQIDNGNVVGVVTLDLEKAFDLISFDVILEKIRHLGFDTETLSWFQDYFTNREQLTSVNGYLSESRPVESGVPQGSILGPLLFILTLNDLHKSIRKCSLSLYADDTCIYFASKDPSSLQKTINKDLESLAEWFSNNQLLLNVGKCQFMLIGSKAKLRKFKNVHLKIQNTSLQRVTECKYLGAILDESLTWTPQIENIRSKTLKIFHAVKRVRQFLDKGTSLLLYKTLIQPHFDYCSIIWMTGHTSQLNRLQIIQNRCLRMVLGVNSRFNRETLYSSLKVDQLKERREKQSMIFIYKLLHNLAPKSLSSRVEFRSLDNYTLRNTNTKITLPKPRTNFIRNSPSYLACSLFNNLPIYVRTANSIKTFSKEIFKL